MKIKLTERQVALRKAFREVLLGNWRSNRKTLMFSVTHDLVDIFGGTDREIEDELSEISSIRKYMGKEPIQAWLSKHYRAVSDAMFDGKTNEQCLAIWAKSSYTRSTHKNGLLNDAARKEKRALNTSNRKNRGIAELRKGMPDRWAGSSWNVVK